MKEWIKDIVIALVIALVVVQFIKPTIVKESSMEPNFIANDYLFVSKQAYSFGHEPQRGDVVVFKSDLPRDDGKGNKLLIKRVIGLPGDKLTILDGKVYINDELYEEDYTKDGYTPDTIVDYTVPDAEYFCMGDNRVVSIDSRDPAVGPVERSRLVGKVVFRLYPFNKFGTIK